MRIDKDVIASINAIYVLKKLEGKDWQLQDDVTNYSNGQRFRTIMLSKLLNHYLMVVYSDNDVKFFISLSKEKDYEVINELELFIREKNLYSVKRNIHNNETYYYEFRFEDFDLFHYFYKKNIMPKMGFLDSNNLFSWI